MDPTANLKRQLELAKEAQAIWDSADSRGNIEDYKRKHLSHIADELATLVISLDEWICKGGFLPEQWRNR